MPNSEHASPGPWVLVQEMKETRVLSADGYFVATIFAADTPSGKANARRILAAAPASAVLEADKMPVAEAREELEDLLRTAKASAVRRGDRWYRRTKALEVALEALDLLTE